MKISSKSVRSLICVVLAMMLAFSLCGFAFATSNPTSAPDSAISDETGDLPTTGGGDPEPTTRSTSDLPSELPTTAGIGIHTLNQYSMRYTSIDYDAELEKVMLNFELSDAGKLAALLDYCTPVHYLAEDLETVKKAGAFTNDSDAIQAKMRIQDVLVDLLLNAGGGPDYRYIKFSEVVKEAEDLLESEEYQKLVEALEPLTALEKTDARSLMLTFTDEELAKICDDLHEAVFGEWSLRLQWLDEMTFQCEIPLDK